MKLTQNWKNNDILFYNSLKEQGIKIIWLDEAGRWTWAWPIVSGWVYIPENHIFPDDIYWIIKDSKKINESKRNKLYDYIINNLPYSVGIASSIEIDKFGIQPMNKKIMNDATDILITNKTDKFFALVDWTLKFDQFPIDVKSIIDWDDFILEISLASVVAKVYRDQLMIEYSKIYANYWFENHKGYWTKEHMNSLNSYGLINWFHRVSYKPIKQHFEKQNINRNH